MKTITEKQTLSVKTTRASAILIDARNKAISKIDVEPTDTLYDQIYLNQDDNHWDYVSAVAQSTSCVIVASDCGFILRVDGKKFIVPGCAIVERIWCHDNLDRMDTPYEVTDFVISDKQVKGKISVQWL